MMVRDMRKQWDAVGPKYGAFPSAQGINNALVAEPVDWASMVCVCLRLIVLWRLLHVYRWIDLAQLKRAHLEWEGKHYILAWRTRWAQY